MCAESHQYRPLNVKNNLHHVRNIIHYGSLLRYGHTNMSTKEKSLLASLVITLLVFGNFFLNTLGLALADEPIANISKSLVNVVISHVPGARTDLYWQGCRLEGLYPVSLIVNRIALNITLVSRRDTIDFGLIGCRKTVPHLQHLLSYLEEALDELDPQ